MEVLLVNTVNVSPVSMPPEHCERNRTAERQHAPGVVG